MDNVDKLYDYYNLLTEAKDEVQKHEKEYQEILNAAKGGAKEKQLASQFIVRFLKHFPHLVGKAIDALLDLCEDDDVAIRKQAIKDLPAICREDKSHVPKIADILAQILASDDPNELIIVHTSLMNLFGLDARGALAGIFSQIKSGDEILRERGLKLLATKLKTVSPMVFNKDVKDVLAVECKNLLSDVTAEEFVLIMNLLALTGLTATVTGQQQLVDIVAEQCTLDQPLTAAEPEALDRLILCLKHTLHYFSNQVKSTKFVNYICQHVLPNLNQLTVGEKSEQVKLDIFKVLAELSRHAGALEKPIEGVEACYKTLLEYMPLPPPEETNGVSEEPKLEFTYVECLMYAFHQLAKQCPEFLTENADRLKDFRIRLQFFARGSQGYMKKLREALQGKSGDQLNSDENKVKVMGLKTTSNINALIKDLFHNPPSYKATVTLSFQQAVKKAGVKSVEANRNVEAAINKRHAPITFGEGGEAKKQVKGKWEPYNIPSGKYSSNFQGYQEGQPRRGGFRGRSGFRGGRGFRRGGRGQY